jgi:hypothetical protein
MSCHMLLIRSSAGVISLSPIHMRITRLVMCPASERGELMSIDTPTTRSAAAFFTEWTHFVYTDLE